MPSTFQQLSPTRVKLTVEIPFADLKPNLDKAYKAIAEQVNIPGFRKGKVPPVVIDQRFGRGVVLQEAINDALPQAYTDACTEHKILPLGQPEIDVTKLEDGELVEFVAEVDVRPDFEMPSAADVKVSVDDVTVTDEQLDERINLLRQRFATNAEVDRAAAEGDLVTVDLEGSKDGEVLAEASAEGVTFKIGQEGMLDGMAEAVTGKSAGEDVTFTSTLVGGPLRGQEVEIKATIQKVQEQTLPELDDDFAQMVSEFDTVDEMKDDLRTAMERAAKEDQTVAARDKVLEALIAATTIELPEALSQSEVQARRDQINQQLAQAGLTLEQYLADSEEEEAEDAETFWASVEQRSLDALRAQILLDKYADDKEIGVSQSELTELIFRKAQASGTSPEQEMQHMMEHNHIGEWMQEVRRTKALQELVEAAEVTDASGNQLDLSLPKPEVVEPPVEDDEDAVDAADDDQAEEAKADDQAEDAENTEA